MYYQTMEPILSFNIQPLAVGVAHILLSNKKYDSIRPNFSLGCPIQGNNISIHLKLNKEGSQKIQIDLTFHSAVRFTSKIYREIKNGSARQVQTGITFDSDV